MALQLSRSSNLQAEGLCLHFPENLPPHANLSHELAVQMLGRAISLAEQAAFQPSYIDKPPGDASPQPHLSSLSVQMAKSAFALPQVALIFHQMASGLWSMSNMPTIHPSPAGRVRE